MRDRVSTKILGNGAARYGVYDEDGNLLRYEYIKLEDEPDEEGTVLNKANLLSDETAARLGMKQEDPTVNEAFEALANSPAGTGTLYVYCKNEAGEPVSGCVVQIGEELAATGASGVAKYFLAPGDYSVAIRSPIDYGAEVQTVSVSVALSEVVTVEATIQDSMDGVTELRFTSAVVAAFSGRVTSADAFGVGGGGSGGAANRVNSNGNYIWGSASGGAGGKTKTVKNIPLGVVFSVSIGTGGAAVTNTSGGYTDGKTGGTTKITSVGVNEIILSVSGGAGGIARSGGTGTGFLGTNGANGGSGSGATAAVSGGVTVGASGSDGADGESVSVDGGHTGGSGQKTTTRAFGENNGELFAPAGGGAARYFSTEALGACADGAGVGASAFTKSSGTAANAVASNATTRGGGGGGAVCLVYGNTNYTYKCTSGAGAGGIVIFRWEVAA